MSELVARCGFIYGCIGTTLALAWYLAAVFNRAVLPGNLWVVEAVFLIHGCVAVVTFHQRPAGPGWKPLIQVTPRKIRIAKLVLGLSLLNYCIYLVALVFAGVRGDLALGNRVVPLLLTSFALLNTVYVGLHWAFRPRNLFSIGFLRAISNPLGFIVRQIHRR